MFKCLDCEAIGTNSIVQKREEQTKYSNIFVPGSARSPSPIIVDMVIEEIRAMLTPPKRFRIQSIILPLGSVENSEKCTPRLNPHNFVCSW